jgi:putative two-component system response regulator
MKRRILIVDDDPLITRSLETFLKFTFEGEFISFNSPVEALKSVEEFAPDIVISDFLMPNLNGLDFLKEVKVLCPESILVLLTGYADKENAIRCINEVGIYYYAEKPWDNALLSKILQNGFEKINLKKELKRRLVELEESNNEISRIYSLLKKDYDSEVDNLQNLLITLANLIESKDSYTDGHTRRVGSFSKLIGMKIGLPPEKIRTLEITGIIHDIGKVGVSEEILNKPGKLTDEEFEEMKKHTVLGHHICKPLNILKDCLDPIRHHHEKLDGSGYPDGLKGDEISIEARIIAVSDIFDALYSDRPYRSKMDISLVRKILFEEAEKGFIDKKIVEILFHLYDNKELEAIING